MQWTSWLVPPRRLLALSVLLMLVPASALVWLGWRLLEQDRALEREQLRERCERAAELVSTVLERSLNAEEGRLAEASSGSLEPPPPGAVLVTLSRRGGLQVLPPGGLVFRPYTPALREPPSEPFLAGEELEFDREDYAQALARYRALAASPDPDLQAGALLRIARVLRKSRRVEEALTQYQQLTGIDSVAFGGVPVSLLAHRSRCLLLEENGRPDELNREARAMAAELQQGRWPLDRASYDHYTSIVDAWLGQRWETRAEGEALSAGASWLWRQWAGSRSLPASGRRAVRTDGAAVALVWRTSGEQLTALVATQGYQDRHWISPALSTAAVAPVEIALLDETDRPAFGVLPGEGDLQVLRSSASTGVPWTVAAYDGAGGLSSRFASRRRLLLAGLAALMMLVFGGSFLIGRAISRELAVARLQSDFVSAVSHEFRTPLTSLQQSTELLVDNDDLSREDREHFYQAQDRATRRLRRLVESLLDFGRMESGRKAYRLEPLDAARLVRSVVDEFRNESGASDFTIRCDAGDTPLPVQGDAAALSWALWNLLDNAAKYSGDSRNVEVEVDRDGDRPAIRVRDYGIGIAPQDQKQIFHKFERGDAATRDGIPGTGIGLAMVKHVVEAHHGEIRLDSRPGEGSTFTLVLPAGD